MNKVPKGVQKLIVKGVVQKIEGLLSSKHLISEEQIKKEYSEVIEIISWGKKNCSVYEKLQAI